MEANLNKHGYKAFVAEDFNKDSGHMEAITGNITLDSKTHKYSLDGEELKAITPSKLGYLAGFNPNSHKSGDFAVLAEKILTEGLDRIGEGYEGDDVFRYRGHAKNEASTIRTAKDVQGLYDLSNDDRFFTAAKNVGSSIYGNIIHAAMETGLSEEQIKNGELFQNQGFVETYNKEFKKYQALNLIGTENDVANEDEFKSKISTNASRLTTLRNAILGDFKASGFEHEKMLAAKFAPDGDWTQALTLAGSVDEIATGISSVISDWKTTGKLNNAAIAQLNGYMALARANGVDISKLNVMRDSGNGDAFAYDISKMDNGQLARMFNAARVSHLYEEAVSSASIEDGSIIDKTPIMKSLLSGTAFENIEASLKKMSLAGLNNEEFSNKLENLGFSTKGAVIQGNNATKTYPAQTADGHLREVTGFFDAQGQTISGKAPKIKWSQSKSPEMAHAEKYYLKYASLTDEANRIIEQSQGGELSEADQKRIANLDMQRRLAKAEYDEYAKANGFSSTLKKTIEENVLNSNEYRDAKIRSELKSETIKARDYERSKFQYEKDYLNLEKQQAIYNDINKRYQRAEENSDESRVLEAQLDAQEKVVKQAVDKLDSSGKKILEEDAAKIKEKNAGAAVKEAENIAAKQNVITNKEINQLLHEREAIYSRILLLSKQISEAELRGKDTNLLNEKKKTEEEALVKNKEAIDKKSDGSTQAKDIQETVTAIDDRASNMRKAQEADATSQAQKVSADQLRNVSLAQYKLDAQRLNELDKQIIKLNNEKSPHKYTSRAIAEELKLTELMQTRAMLSSSMLKYDPMMRQFYQYATDGKGNYVDAQGNIVQDASMAQKKYQGSQLTDSQHYALMADQTRREYKLNDLNQKSLERGYIGKFKKLGNQFQSIFWGQMFYRLVMQVMQVFSNAINTTKQLNQAITNLQIVTGKSQESVKSLVKGYSSLAKELGSTTSEVSASANEWLRMGYNTEQVNTLITNSMMLSKLGMIDTAKATEYLTSAIKGYNVSVAESSKIIDMATALDMKYAVSSGYILEAMSKTAASAKLAKVEMSDLQSMIAVVGEVTQKDASVIGESFKTAFARYGNVKAGVFSNGIN